MKFHIDIVLDVQNKGINELTESTYRIKQKKVSGNILQ